MVAFNKTGAKLRDGVIPAGTTVWKKSKDRSIIELIVLEEGLIPTHLRKQVQSKTHMISMGGNCGRYSQARKCRVRKAYVVSITGQDGTPVESARSMEDYTFVYKPGTVMIPDGFDTDPMEVCTQGIHVFLSREEAVAYDWS